MNREDLRKKGKYHIEQMKKDLDIFGAYQSTREDELIQTSITRPGPRRRQALLMAAAASSVLTALAMTLLLISSTS